MTQTSYSRIATALVCCTAYLLSGCSSLLAPAKSEPAAVYSFDIAQLKPIAAPAPSSGAPTLLLSAPRAAPGFDGKQIAYVRQSHKLEYFRDSHWVDDPATMLSPLIAAALERSGTFGAVVQAPTSALGQYRLDVELVRLQQEFMSMPSNARITLRAHLLDAKTHAVVAWREFDSSVPSAGEDAYGGVVAANLAVRIAIEELAAFCSQAIAAQNKISPSSLGKDKK